MILSVNGNVDFLQVELVVVLPVEQHLVLPRDTFRQRQPYQPDVSVAAEFEDALEFVGLGAHDEVLASEGIGQAVGETESGLFEKGGLALPMRLRKTPWHRQFVPADDVDEQRVFLLQGEVVDVDEALGEVLWAHGEEAEVGQDGAEDVAQLQRLHVLHLPAGFLFGPPERRSDQVGFAV